jgi:nucleoside-diphosphate-sugar epimerase
MMQRKTILLTGAAGFIGRHILKEAAAQGSRDRWILTDLAVPGNWWGLPVHTRFLGGNLCEAPVVEKIFETWAPDVVIHMAGWIGRASTPENREALLRANLMSTFYLLDAIKARNRTPPLFMLPSTGLIYGDQKGPFQESFELAPLDDYSLSKLLAEQTLRTFSTHKVVRSCVIRPAVIYGEGQRSDMFIPSLVKALLEGRRFPMTAGEQKRDMLFVSDLARAILLLAGLEIEGVFNVGTGVGMPMKTVAEIASRVFDSEGSVGLGEIPYRPNEVWDYALDPSRLMESTGWAPQVDLEEGVRRTIEWEAAAL